jgi:hypothetical protein
MTAQTVDTPHVLLARNSSYTIVVFEVMNLSDPQKTRFGRGSKPIADAAALGLGRALGGEDDKPLDLSAGDNKLAMDSAAPRFHDSNARWRPPPIAAKSSSPTPRLRFRSAVEPRGFSGSAARVSETTANR